MTFSNFVTIGFGLLLIVTAVGCQVTPATPVPQPRATNVHETDPESLLEQAAKAAPGEAARLRLRASLTYQASRAPTDARAALQRVDPALLDAANRFAFYELKAKLALDVPDFAAAQQALALAIPTNTLQRNSLASTTADLAEAEQRFEDAATELLKISLSRPTADAAAQQALVDRIWGNINRTPTDRISQLAGRTDDPTAAAWWELASALQRSFDLNAERAAIVSWREHHRDHPAALMPPSALKQLENGEAAPSRIGLLLPISGPLSSAGRAVRDGFLAAYYHSGSNSTVRVYDSYNSTLASLYERASMDGVQLIVGPLDKAGVVDINTLADRRVPVLALNYLPAGTTATPGLFQFGLAIEDEARAIARRMNEDGLHRVAILESALDWSTRAGQSFREQFEATGGTVVAIAVIEDARTITDVVGNALLVNASTARMEEVARTIGSTPEFIPRRRSDVDALVAFVDPSGARALNPAMAFYFAADVPIYATSQAAGGTTKAELAELDGFRLSELPWQVYPSDVRDEVNAAFSNAGSNLSPLYALGVDAYRLAGRADLLSPSSSGGLLGATGQLQIQSSGAVVRYPAWAVVSHGVLVALPTVAP